MGLAAIFPTVAFSIPGQFLTYLLKLHLCSPVALVPLVASLFRVELQ